MALRLKGRRKKAGMPPGSLVYTGVKVHKTTKIDIMVYSEQHLEEKTMSAWEECLALPGDGSVTWINVQGISQVGNLEKLGECFKLHPLVLEDILNIEERSKIEDYDDYLYIVLKAISDNPQTEEIEVGQISLVLGANYVISFLENNGDLFAPIRERLVAAKGRLRKAGADYLAYSLVDLIVDQYFVSLEAFGDSIESLEDEVVSQPTPQTLQTVHRFKNNMILLRKSLWPLREVVARLERRESPLITDATALYFKDVYDHAIIAVDTVETYRDILSGMLDIYLSSISYRLNEVMKVLTIIATIFMPLTFLAGVYGMNFKHMPELEMQYGYYGALGVMALVAVGMLLYFRKKKWI